MPAEAIIDLGVPAAGEPDGEGAPGEPRPPSRVAAAVVLVLLLAFTVAGSAPMNDSGWRAGQLPLAAGDDFALSGDLLMVAGKSTVTAYRVPLLDVVWTLAVPAAEGYSLTRAGDLLVIGARNGVGRQQESLVVTAATGLERWRHAGRLVPVPGSDVLLAVSDVRSTSGSGRRVTDVIEGIDTSGARRWSIRLPSSAVVAPLPAGEFLLVHDDGTAQIRAASDAVPRATGELPPAAYAPDNPRLIGGMVVLRHPGDNTSRISGYDGRTLAHRWSRTVGGLQSVDRCGDLLCLGTTIGVRALDPVDGSNAWVSQSWRRAMSWGDMTVAYGRPTGLDAELALVEPMTGGAVLDLSAWQQVTSVTDDVVLAHPDAARGVTLVATVASDRRSVRVLGAIPAASGGCRAGGGVLACRQGGGILGVWALD
ncbi:hypothetical protein J2S43_005458 [Catenuloplanes nepalensis]|uniref:Pyrroloquinoline-quinone binding quinoprotein n=1 Tax=Catenuloplanes nepalensis TaxID=587533 RepID=A0ABT9MZS3_9ACTN|nr:hypothetical protein [Catenuloplanes nepalensis]MDP9796946.1 hypothetical protein [Catenuloplanes nepalensis]